MPLDNSEVKIVPLPFSHKFSDGDNLGTISSIYTIYEAYWERASAYNYLHGAASPLSELMPVVGSFAAQSWYSLLWSTYQLAFYWIASLDEGGKPYDLGSPKGKMLFKWGSEKTNQLNKMDATGYAFTTKPENPAKNWLSDNPNDEWPPLDRNGKTASGFTRKYPREIFHLDDYGEDGWIARFVVSKGFLGTYFDERSQFGDDMPNIPIRRAGATAKLTTPLTPIDQYAMAGFLFKFTGGKWEYDFSAIEPDIVETRGLPRT